MIEDFAPLERAWDEAYLNGDVEALDALWSDDIVIILPGAKPIQKWHALDLAKTGRRTLVRYETTIDSTANINGIAMVTGKIVLVRKIDGQLHTQRWQYMKTYVRNDEKWKVLGFVATIPPRT